MNQTQDRESRLNTTQTVADCNAVAPSEGQLMHESSRQVVSDSNTQPNQKASGRDDRRHHDDRQHRTPREHADRDTREHRDRDTREHRERDTREHRERDTREHRDSQPWKRNERDSREFGDRPPRERNERDSREFGDRPPRERNERDSREFGRNSGEHGDRPLREHRERDSRENGDRQPREFGRDSREHRDSRENGDRDSREFERDSRDVSHRNRSPPPRKVPRQERDSRQERPLSTRPKPNSLIDAFFAPTRLNSLVPRPPRSLFQSHFAPFDLLDENFFATKHLQRDIGSIFSAPNPVFNDPELEEMVEECKFEDSDTSDEPQNVTYSVKVMRIGSDGVKRSRVVNGVTKLTKDGKTVTHKKMISNDPSGKTVREVFEDGTEKITTVPHSLKHRNCDRDDDFEA